MIRKNWRAFAFLVACLIAWNALSNSGIVQKTLFPPPAGVLSAIFEWYFSGRLVHDSLTSLWRLAAGTAIGVALGFIVGIAMGLDKPFEETGALFLNILRAMPPIALLPLMIIWFGISDMGKILLVAFGTFFPAWISGMNGAKSIPIHYFHTAKMFSKSKIETFSKVILHATIPFLVNGARIAIGFGFTLVFASEISGASEGIGYFIAKAQIIYRADQMIAGLIVLGLLAAIVDYLFVHITRRVFPWVDGI